MPVIGIPPYLSCDEVHPGRGGTPFNGLQARDYTRRYRVVMTSPVPSAVIVGQCPLLPLPYSPYRVAAAGPPAVSDGYPYVEYDTAALLVKRACAPEDQDDYQRWLVTDTYSTDIGLGQVPGNFGRPGGGGGGAGDNPELEPPELQFDWEAVHRAPPYDLRGALFLNSARTPYSPPPQIEYGVQVLALTRNEVGYDMRTADYYAHSVNDSSFLGYDRACVLLDPPRATYHTRPPLVYARVTYRFKFWPDFADEDGWSVDDSGGLTYDASRKSSWQLRVLDAGLQRIETNPANTAFFNKPVPIRTAGGAEVTTPVPLDGKGQRAVPDANGRIRPAYTDYKTHKLRSFAKLLDRGVAGRVGSRG